jgi:hypothetical protein
MTKIHTVDKDVKNLIKGGKENGFITQDNILEIFPKP